MDRPQRIGVFGGAFDPIHNAHIDVAREALDAARLDKVLFVVAARPPHKRGETVASPEERFAMVEAALGGEAQMEACDLEMKREGPSYMCDTLEQIDSMYPGADLFLIIGLDSLLDLPGWRNPEKITSRARLLVVPRPTDGRAVPDSLQDAYEFLPFEETEVSSTEIRRRIATGENVTDLVPAAVEDLLLSEGYYGN